ncbi:MAG: hypothetical protein AAFX93_13580 [Verrucomicrobiota bacterium]
MSGASSKSDGVQASAVIRRNPYPGLRPFQVDEWSIFFGRERMIDDVIERMGESQYVVIHGASGSGKSSLIRAGVIAQLQREHQSRGLDWRPAVMMPGSSPMWHFATALLTALSSDDHDEPWKIAQTRVRLSMGSDGVADLLQEAGFGPDQRLFILVDQFEEIFRFADEGGVEEATEFIELLVDLHRHPLSGVYLAMTMRSDHIGECSRFSGLSEVVNNCQYLVPPMEERELIEAICRPASIECGHVSEGLALRLIKDTRHTPDQLPLIQHALCYMWALEVDEAPDQNPTLNLDDYARDQIGSVTHALSNHADEALKELASDGRPTLDAAEHVFRALTQVDSSGRTIRRRLGRKKLLGEVSCSEAVLDRVIKVFAASNRTFLFQEKENPEMDPKVDISHESLIRHWEKLEDDSIDPKTGRPGGWVSREAYDGAVWHGLVATVTSAPRPSEAQLPKIVYERRQEWWHSRNPNAKWAQRHGGHFDEVKELLSRSRKKIEDDERRQRETEEAKEAARRKAKFLAWIASVFAVIAIGMAIFAAKKNFQLRESLVNAERLVVSERAALDEANRAKNAAYASKDKAIKSEEMAINALRRQWQLTLDKADAFKDDPVVRSLIALEFLPDASVEDDDRKNYPSIPRVEQELREALSAEARVAVVYEDQEFAQTIESLDFNYDGSQIAMVSDRGETVRVIDASSKDTISKIEGEFREFEQVKFGPFGSRIAVTRDLSGKWSIFDAKSGVEEQMLDFGPDIDALAWSPDGGQIVTGSIDGSLRIWDVGKDVPTLDVNVSSIPISWVEFDSTGSKIVGGLYDGELFFWDIEKSERPQIIVSGSSRLVAGALLPDGNSIVRLSDKGQVDLVDLASSEVKLVTKIDSVGRSLAVAPFGRWIAIGCSDGRVKIVDLDNTNPVETTDTLGREVDALSWSVKGNSMAAGTYDGSLAIISFYTPEEEVKGKNLESMTTQELVEFAQASLPYCFSENERKRLGLSEAVPDWCREERAYPFDASGRMARALGLLPGFPKKSHDQFNDALFLAGDGQSLDMIHAIKKGAMLRALTQLSDGAKSPSEFNSRKKRLDEFIQLATELELAPESQLKDAEVAFLVESSRNVMRHDRTNEPLSSKWLADARAIDHSGSLEARWRLTLDDARNLAIEEETDEDAEAGVDPIVEILIALEFLPAENADIDSVPEIVESLQRSLLNLRNQPSIERNIVHSFDDEIEMLDIDADGRAVVHFQDHDVLYGKSIDSGQSGEYFKLSVGNLSAIEFSPNNSRLLVSSYDGFIEVLDPNSGDRQIDPIEAHAKVVDAVWLSDTEIVYATDEAVFIRNLDDVNRVEKLEVFEEPVFLNVHPESKKLLVASSGMATVWELDGAPFYSNFSPEGYLGFLHAEWADDGNFLITVDDGDRFDIWQKPDNKRRDSGYVLREVPFEQRFWEVNAIDVSRDGRWLVIGSEDYYLDFYDLKEQRFVAEAKVDDAIVFLEWSDSGESVNCSTSDGSIIRFDFFTVGQNYQHQIEELVAGQNVASDRSGKKGPGSSLVDLARNVVPYCFGEWDRESLLLDEEIPDWCITWKKPPFDFRGRVDRASELMNGGESEVADAFRIFKELEMSHPESFEAIQKERLASVQSRLSQLSGDADSYIRFQEKLSKLEGFTEQVNAVHPEMELDFDYYRFELAEGAAKQLLEYDQIEGARQAFAIALGYRPELKDRIVLSHAEAALSRGELGVALLLALEVADSNPDAKEFLARYLSLDGPTQRWPISESPIIGISVDPENGAYLASGGSEVYRWNPESEDSELLLGDVSDAGRIALSPDGSRFIVGSSLLLPRIWDFPSGDTSAVLETNAGDSIGAAWSSNGELIALSDGFDGGTYIFNSESGIAEATLKGANTSDYGVCFSPVDEKLVLTGGSGLLQIWDISSASPIFTLEVDENIEIYDVDWSVDGDRIVYCGENGTAGLLIRDENGNWKNTHEFDHNSEVVFSVAFDSTGELFATGSENGIMVWDTTSGDLIRRLVDTQLDPDDEEAVPIVVKWASDGNIYAGMASGNLLVFNGHGLDSTDEAESVVERARDRVERELTEEERWLYNLTEKQPGKS